MGILPKNSLAGPAWLVLSLALTPSVFAEGMDCQPGQTTVLVSGCANAWTPNEKGVEPYPWDTLPTVADRHRQSLDRSTCPSLKVLEVYPRDQVARVKCEREGAKELLVNLDLLACHSAPYFFEEYQVQGTLGLTALSVEGCYKDPFVEVFAGQPVELPIGWNKISPKVGRNILGSAVDKFQKTQSDLENDNKTVTCIYLDGQDSHCVDVPPEWQGMPDGARVKAIGHGENELSLLLGRAMATYGPDCANSDDDSTRGVQGRHTCRLLKRAVEVARQVLKDPKAVRSSIANFAFSHAQGATPDDLAARMVLYYGLPAATRESLVHDGKIRFWRKSTEIGRGPPFLELHNDYVVGGHRIQTATSKSGERETGFDCSDFVTEVLSGIDAQENGAHAPWTGMFMNVAEGAPVVAASPDAQSQWSGLADCFDQVNLRDGQVPEPADIVIQRTPLRNSGHMVIVSSYNPNTGVISTYEAAGSRDTVVGPESSGRPLFEPVPKQCGHWPAWDGKRPIFPGLRVLRFKENPPPSCPLRPSASSG